MQVVEAEETNLGCARVLEWGHRWDPRAHGTCTHPMGKQQTGAPASSATVERCWPRRAPPPWGVEAAPNELLAASPWRRRWVLGESDGERRSPARRSPLLCVATPMSRVDWGVGVSRRRENLASPVGVRTRPWFSQQNTEGEEPRVATLPLQSF
jgi:hypothetical protein